MSRSSIPSSNRRSQGENAPRHRVKNNLPGTPDFCPLVFRTEALERFIGHEPAAARAGDRRRCPARPARPHGGVSAAQGFASRATRSKASARRRTVSSDGAAPSAKPAASRSIVDELLRLQRIVIGDARFVNLGFARKAASSASMTAKPACRCPTISAPGTKTCHALIDGMIAFDRGPAQTARPCYRRRGPGLRLCLHSPVRGRQRPDSPLPDPPCPGSSADSIRRASSFRSPPRSWSGSTTIGACWKAYSQRLLPVIEWEPTESSTSAF